jgi:hypothetical protein
VGTLEADEAEAGDKVEAAVRASFAITCPGKNIPVASRRKELSRIVKTCCDDNGDPVGRNVELE